MLFKNNKRPSRGLSLRAILILLLACGCLSMFAAISRPRDDESASRATSPPSNAIVGIPDTPQVDTKPTREEEAPSATPRPTFTAGPTETPQPTRTTDPTETPQPTATEPPTATPWPSLTPVDTPSPKQIAATARAGTAEARSAAATATAEDRRLSVAATATERAQKANWGRVAILEFDKDPDAYIGQQVVFTGRVFNIDTAGSTVVAQIWVASPTGNVAVVVACDKFNMDGVVDGSRITVYGMGGGRYTGTNAFGAEIEQPVINCVYVTR